MFVNYAILIYQYYSKINSILNSLYYKLLNVNYLFISINQGIHNIHDCSDINSLNINI